MKPRFYGEVLTVDDVYQRLAEEEREKEETRKRKAKKARSSTRLTGSKVARKKSPRQGRTKRQRKVCILSNHSSTNSDSKQEEVTLSYGKEGATSSEIEDLCQECHEREDDDEEYWIGCDTCVRWFHYHCVGLTSIPDGFWSSPYCLSH